jgi:hypothetical protein
MQSTSGKRAGPHPEIRVGISPLMHRFLDLLAAVPPPANPKNL